MVSNLDPLYHVYHNFKWSLSQTHRLPKRIKLERSWKRGRSHIWVQKIMTRGWMSQWMNQYLFKKILSRIEWSWKDDEQRSLFKFQADLSGGKKVSLRFSARSAVVCIIAYLYNFWQDCNTKLIFPIDRLSNSDVCIITTREPTKYSANSFP